MTATVARGQRGWQETTAIVLLVVGGFLWGVGWLVGVVLLWLSDVWSLRQKLLGTFVVPGGLALPFLAGVYLALGTGSQTCVGSATVESCTGGRPAWERALWGVVLVAGLAGSILTAVHLARTSRRGRSDP